ncbi:tol-pal system protein YbgF [Psychromonas sp. Urea-02u-13]|uniref:tol-pal system protein YbgF n=1 Tax=Psychromonas sp. Urea-02u-13 TaxID=2058326 RepID=UPI000C32D3CF|nr:tol-pal system protein YbgF [Psychromonas sp. Urea-02u-13]PKG40338.1 tol-pal system protein YbgF [Psychromonas sp. Urea-02u-13]
MKKVNLNVAIFMATFLSASSFADAPVSDVTSVKSNKQIEKQLDDLTRLLESRNRMQIRFQNQLDELSQEVSQISGNIELFNHKIEQIENRQRNLYQLIDEQKNAVAKAPIKNSPESNESVAVDEKAAYQSAVDLVLVEKDYEQAITAFEAFVIDHPESSLIANSQYWLGQLLYKGKKRDEARIAFLIVTEKYPDSSKRADALFKVGIIDEYLGKKDSARAFYEKVLKEYADSSAASLASKRLKAL